MKKPQIDIPGQSIVEELLAPLNQCANVKAVCDDERNYDDIPTKVKDELNEDGGRMIWQLSGINLKAMGQVLTHMGENLLQFEMNFPESDAVIDALRFCSGYYWRQLRDISEALGTSAMYHENWAIEQFRQWKVMRWENSRPNRQHDGADRVHRDPEDETVD